MSKNILLSEMERKLSEVGGVNCELKNDRLRITIGEENKFEVSPSGGITFYPKAIHDDEWHKAGMIVINTVREVKDYVDIVENAPKMKVEGIGDGFKKIADFNNIVLAGKYLNDNDGFQFVTWMYDKTGVCAGQYYAGNFEKAKESFAERSGLINSSKLFSDEEFSEIYRCVSDTLYGGFELKDEQREMLEGIQEKIKESVKNLFELINQAENQGFEQSM